MSVRVVFMGTPRFAVPSLDALLRAGYEVAAVVTQPDKPAGRGNAARQSAVKAFAVERGIGVLEPFRMKDPAFLAELAALRPDYIVVVAYGKILPEAVLTAAPGGCINVHASLLPRYRGAAPISWAIVNGDLETGVTTMLLDRGMDTGPTYLGRRLPINDDDTAETLSEKLSAAGAELLVETLSLIEKRLISPTPQDDSAATMAPILKKEDGLVDWSRTAREVYNRIRGLYPWPGAYTRLDGRVLKIHGARLSPKAAPEAEPGTVVDTSSGAISVMCSGSVIDITELQPENKKRMSAADFLKGYRLKAGARFN